MTEPMDRNGPDRNIIDGSPVIAREIARLPVPASKNADGLSTIRGIDKCLLEDSREVYQCASTDANPQCNWWHEKGESVRAHLRAHTERTKFKVEKLKAERDELLAREQQRRENYRLGALKGAANRRARRENDVNGSIAENGDETSSMTPGEYQKKLNRAQLSVEGVSEGLEKMQTVLANINKTLHNTMADLDDLLEMELELAVDPVLAEKAASWDAMQALLKGTKG